MNDLHLPQHIYPVTFGDTPALKEMAIEKLLKTHQVDGIVAGDDLTALLIVKMAEKLKIPIPQKLKVIGFDGTNFIQTYYPNLSTIVQPISDIAQVLVKLLEERIKNPDLQIYNSPYILPVKLLKSTTSAN